MNAGPKDTAVGYVSAAWTRLLTLPGPDPEYKTKCQEWFGRVTCMLTLMGTHDNYGRKKGPNRGPSEASVLLARLPGPVGD